MIFRISVFMVFSFQIHLCAAVGAEVVNDSDFMALAALSMNVPVNHGVVYPSSVPHRCNIFGIHIADAVGSIFS